MTTITLKTGQVSPIYPVSPGTRITSDGNGSIEYTAGTLTDAKNNPDWTTWPLGSTAGYMDTVRQLCIRATATADMEVTLEEGRADKYPDDVYFDTQMVSTQTDPTTGGVILVGAGGEVLVRPVVSYAWANRPAAADNTGITIRITDIGGSAGSLWISDGAYWKPVGGRVVLAGSAVAVADPHDTTENILASVLVPAGCMGVGGSLSIVHSWSMTNSANVKTLAIRLGAAGVITGTHLWSSPQTTVLSIRAWTELQNRDATNLQVGGTGVGNSLLSGGINGDLVTAAVDTTIDRYLVFTGKKDAAAAAASENLKLERYIVELIVP